MGFNDNNRAIYLQIADAIADAIAAGTMLPDSRIPSVREYAARVMVNVNTVMRAYEQLAAAGIIYNRRGMGFYVAEGAAENIVAMRRREFIDGGGLERMFRQLQLLRVGPKELADMYNTYLSKQ